ncbi:MAG: hypothetical protein MUC48_07640 [Leptolyngbya sp. Prado105]|jgi:hypothetical protein|nr:hypothetical protein [Leptolyngbya sp. Prado105]
MSELNTENQPHEAQLVAEEIANGDLRAPKIDVAADYEAAQEFSTSSIDDTEEGQKAAEAATAPQFEVESPEDVEIPTSTIDSTGDPTDYQDLAKQVNPISGTAGNVDDDLVKKALELGKPGNS